MATGKGENKTRWEDVIAGFKVEKPKKASTKATGSTTGSGTPPKDDDAAKNGGGTEGAAATDTTKV